MSNPTEKGWQLPAIIDPDEVCFQISIPNDVNHVRAFFGSMQSLAEWWNWQPDEEHTGTLVAQVWRRVANNAYQSYLEQECENMFDVRQNTTDECILEKSEDGGETWTPFADLQLCPPLIRIGERGILEVSSDGGETWTEAEIITPPPSAPPTGQDPHCLSARNAVEVYRQTWLAIYDQWSGGADILVGIAAAISIIATAIFYPIAVPVVWAFFQALWDVLSLLTGGEWTDTVTDTLTCIFYCNSVLNEDGTITFQSESAVADAIAAQGSANTIWGVIYYLWNIVSTTGTEQAASTRSIAEADCSSCLCICGAIDFTIGKGNFIQTAWTASSCGRTDAFNEAGEWISGSGWSTEDIGGGVAQLGLVGGCEEPSSTLYFKFTSTINSIFFVEVRRSDNEALLGCAYIANTAFDQGWHNLAVTSPAGNPVTIRIGSNTNGAAGGVILTGLQWTAPE